MTLEMEAVMINVGFLSRAHDNLNTSAGLSVNVYKSDYVNQFQIVLFIFFNSSI